MNKQTLSNEIAKLAEDAQELVAATADVAGEKVGEARKRLTYALERGREIYDHVRSKEIEGVCAVDKAMHEHAYEAIAIAVGVGALIGYFAARRCACSRG